jgi:hypothetical protein
VLEVTVISWYLKSGRDLLLLPTQFRINLQFSVMWSSVIVLKYSQSNNMPHVIWDTPLTLSNNFTWPYRRCPVWMWMCFWRHGLALCHFSSHISCSWWALQIRLLCRKPILTYLEKKKCRKKLKSLSIRHFATRRKNEALWERKEKQTVVVDHDPSSPRLDIWIFWWTFDPVQTAERLEAKCCFCKPVRTAGS